MSNDYRGVPIPQSKAQKSQYDKTMRAVYGTRVKIPPPGPEFDALVAKIFHEVMAHGTQGWNITADHVRDVLNTLTEEKG